MSRFFACLYANLVQKGLVAEVRQRVARARDRLARQQSPRERRHRRMVVARQQRQLEEQRLVGAAERGVAC